MKPIFKGQAVSVVTPFIVKGFYYEENGKAYIRGNSPQSVWEVDPDTVQQLATYDKNGKEIYIGDKVLEDDHDTIQYVYSTIYVNDKPLEEADRLKYYIVL